MTLSRTGDEAAPTAVVPVVIPAAASELRITNLKPGIEAELVGSELHIRTRQLRAGVRGFGVGLSSLASGWYHAQTTVRYTVLAPAQGERPMTLDLTVDATGLPLDNIEGRVSFESGPQLGESAEAIISVNVGAAVGLERTPQLSFDDTATPQSLHWASRVISFDGAPWRRTAASDRPWLRVLRGAGTTGVDALDIELDAQRFSDDVPFEDMARITLPIDKPGSLPIVVAIPVTNRLRVSSWSRPARSSAIATASSSASIAWTARSSDAATSRFLGHG